MKIQQWIELVTVAMAHFVFVLKALKEGKFMPRIWHWQHNNSPVEPCIPVTQDNFTRLYPRGKGSGQVYLRVRVYPQASNVHLVLAELDEQWSFLCVDRQVSRQRRDWLSGYYEWTCSSSIWRHCGALYCSPSSSPSTCYPRTDPPLADDLLNCTLYSAVQSQQQNRTHYAKQAYKDINDRTGFIYQPLTTAQRTAAVSYGTTELR